MTRYSGDVESKPSSRRRSSAGPVYTILGVVGEVLITLAAICALYVVWQLWWTGVESDSAQEQARQSVSWERPGSSGATTIAKAQKGDPPEQPTSASTNELIAEVYIPRFGDSWVRNLVQGTDMAQLNLHGFGHYESSQMPGQIGNFAVAAHRTGYGQSLGEIAKLRKGDAIIIRTKDYWYVYRYTSHEIVLPTEVRVVSSNPQNPGQKATKRMITMTTCEPRYTYATHRWIAYGELSYWAKVSDGVPKELATTDSSGKVSFAASVDDASDSAASVDLTSIMVVLFAVYLVLSVAAIAVWRWPAISVWKKARTKTSTGIYGWLLRIQPGAFPVRLILLLLLILIAVGGMFQWAFPWAAANIPYLQRMSNYVTV
ncbi:class E sortase [uncultured Bifidobacterium sp.]|uniref:class E sortase n=1 Tax=uncultured Bifidobacterium sp. TaxID=165187 RepID=UPI002639ACFD|nr:class E sortase [uncultured Bifidobacterium sp.]